MFVVLSNKKAFLGEKMGLNNENNVGELASQNERLPPGVQLASTLVGHTGYVLSVAFDPQGRTLATGSVDKTVRNWDVATGKLLRSLGGHKNTVWSVAFDPLGLMLSSGGGDNAIKLWNNESGTLLGSLIGHEHMVMGVAFDPMGRMLASGSMDTTVKLWDVASGKLLRTLADHDLMVSSVAFDPNGCTIASGSLDKTVKQWDVESGELVRTLFGHTNSVWSVAFDPQGKTLASGSMDGTVKLWQAESGRILRTLEGHTGAIEAVAFSLDGKLMASKSHDNTIRVWDCVTWSTVAIIPEPTYSARWVPTLAFHPTMPLLATAGSEPDTPEDERSRLIHLWELDLDVLLGRYRTNFRPELQSVSYRNAKVVFVGDTGVGKSGLALRMAEGRFEATESTHGRRVWTLDARRMTFGLETSDVLPDSECPATETREIVLWDLAGQPVYRLVHQLSIDEAAVACVLFDARNEVNPFESAAFWARVLKQARTPVPLTLFLVASRIDVGGLPVGPERIEAFAREHGFARVFHTSAFTGDGCDELLTEICRAIPWDELPAVSSSRILAQLRLFVSRLKGNRSNPAGTWSESADRPELLTVKDLHRRCELDVGHALPRQEFVAYLGRLEASGDIEVLTFHTTGQAPRDEDQVLLDPTRIDAYSSAVLVAAKDEPDGPGHLPESRVVQGDFPLAKSERLSDPVSEKHVLWYVMETLFDRDLALRESIGGVDYVVFPSQCTSPLVFPGGTAFGVAFGMSGPVRRTYATLIAQLAHYHGFVKREFFQDAAAYHTQTGQRCLICLRDQGDGTGELHLSFDQQTPESIRQGFVQFIGRHIESKAIPGTFTTRHAYHCFKCSRPFEDDVVRDRLNDLRTDLLCSRCESRTPLVNLLAPPSAKSRTVLARIGDDARTGKQRITAEWVIKGKVAQGQYDVFLSHNSQDKGAVEAIAKKLKSIGLRPWLDKWDLAPGDILVDKLEWAIDHIPCAALFFGPNDAGKWHIMEYRAYLGQWAQKDNARLIPVILPQAREEPKLPIFLRQALWVDMRDWQQPDNDTFYRLVCGMLGRAPGDSLLSKLSARHVWQWQQPDLWGNR
ncbi:MAG: hypothetical protein JWM11_3328 [Planctomycetaceae bacterium]|nr:hypothetical protein [Planctomycetaceae bacterium]